MDTRRKILSCTVGAMLTVVFFLVGDSPAQENTPLRFSCTKYLYYHITDLARNYMGTHSDANVAVAYMDDYSLVPALTKKTVEGIVVLGKLDDDLKKEALDQRIRLKEHLVGWGGVVIVTDTQNPINELTVEQIRKIFLGQYKNWKEVGGLDEPIVTMSRDESVSGTERFFRESVLQGEPTGQQTVRLFDPDIARAVFKRKGSIADARYSEASRGRIRGLLKMIAIKQDEESHAVMPSVDSLRNQTYPMSAPMYLYYDGKSTASGLNEFIQFCAKRGLGEQFAEAKR
ncbi:MAG: substrate-binding domain-containing protein [Desulfomonile tiedjei]|uniref:Substrate-binding domain-containing protein n=1 Tax=Desulfomonile tiedjei TaxID=2358 RepID=A0A9D6V8G0_9BACT|nr:substrate-binding domain-containing protein [Desulfomonile tiedjei]